MERRGSRLSRRQFVVGAAGLGLLAGCGRLPGQAEPAKIARVGYLASNSLGDPDRPFGAAFRQGLHELGYVEGQNVLIEWRVAGETADELAAFAADLVQLPVAVIVAPSTRDVLVAKSATSTIPIVSVLMADPVGSGLIASLARPGGNVTGLSSMTVVLGQKRLELLKDTVPQASRVACLYDPADPASVADLNGMTDAAPVLGVKVEFLGVRAADDLDSAFAAARRLPADALLTTAGPFLTFHTERLVDFAARSRLPAAYHNRSFVDAGGLMSYAANLVAQHRRAAYYVDRILKGANPADLPIEQPMTFDFVVNMKTAAALGLTFPNEIMLQVTEVVQ